MRELGDAVIWLGAVAGALGALAIVARYVIVRPLRAWITEQITHRVAGPLDAVQAEVTPNSGTSMRDQITRIERTVELLSVRLDDHIRLHPGSRP